MRDIPEDIRQAADEALSDGPEFMLPDYGVDTHALRLAIARAIIAERERHGWQPIETFDAKTVKGPWTDYVMLGHSEKKWIRFGRYDLTLKRWYYSGTNERSQWAQVEGDAPTHWMPLPSPPKP